MGFGEVGGHPLGRRDKIEVRFVFVRDLLTYKTQNNSNVSKNLIFKCCLSVTNEAQLAADVFSEPLQ